MLLTLPVNFQCFLTAFYLFTLHLDIALFLSLKAKVYFSCVGLILHGFTYWVMVFSFQVYKIRSVELLLWAMSWDIEYPHYEVAGRQPWGVAAGLSPAGNCTRAEWLLLLSGGQSCILLGVAISFSCCSNSLVYREVCVPVFLT